MVKTFRIADDRVVPCREGETGPISLYINPDEREKKSLVEDFAIDEHTLNSAVDPDELSRLEFEQNHVALIFKRPQNYCAKDQLVFRVASIGVFLFRDR